MGSTTKFRSRDTHIDVVPAPTLDKYFLVISDASNEHVNYQEPCHPVRGVWTHVASQLERALQEHNVPQDFYSLDGSAILACAYSDGPTVDMILTQYLTRPRRPVSKSA